MPSIGSTDIVRGRSMVLRGRHANIPTVVDQILVRWVHWLDVVRSNFGRCLFHSQGGHSWRWMVASRREYCRRIVPTRLHCTIISKRPVSFLSNNRQPTLAFCLRTNRTDRLTISRGVTQVEHDETPLPAALDCRGAIRLFCGPRRQRSKARLFLFRG